MEFVVVFSLFVCFGVMCFTFYIVHRTYENSLEREKQWAKICADSIAVAWEKFNESFKAHTEKEKVSAEWVNYLVHQLVTMAAAQGEIAMSRVEKLFSTMELSLSTTFADAISRGYAVFTEERQKIKESGNEG